MIERFGSKTGPLLVSFLLVGGASAALAADLNPAAHVEGLLNRAPESDWALGWLDAIFYGKGLPQGVADGAVQLAAIAKALREALSIYSLGMLVLAGMVLAYHVVAIVAETANTGVVMGRRTNQFWAPLRFILAIGMLVPIGGGLNTGQYLIVKLAETGSSLASKAWTTAAETLKDNVGALVVPRSPDVTRLTAVATEMEMCRVYYRHIFEVSRSDDSSVIVRSGNIGDINKLDQTRLSPEAWRYTNKVQSGLPLCGEYRFLARAEAEGIPGRSEDETTEMPNDLAAFARIDADKLIAVTRSMAERAAIGFLSESAGTAVPPADIGENMASIILEQQRSLDAKLRVLALKKSTPVDSSLLSSVNSGWASAGFFVGNLVRRQTILGELASNAVPTVQAPLFGHRALDVPLLVEASSGDPSVQSLLLQQTEYGVAEYNQITDLMKKTRAWLYGKQVPRGDFVLADTLDLKDYLNASNDAASGTYAYTRLLNAAMATYGVWSDVVYVNGMPPSSMSMARAVANSPLAGIAEIGRRYGALGSYLSNMAGPGMSEPGVMGAALPFLLTGLLFAASGFMLVFFVPLFPLFRFFIGIVTWLLVVLEAVAALPLVALAHMHPSGEGLSGPIARQAYWLWVSVFMRPLLTLFGFVVGLILLTAALAFLNNLFVPLTYSLYGVQGDVFVSVRVGLSLFYAVMVLVMVNVAFKGITYLPDVLLRWLGTAEAGATVNVMSPAMAGAGRSSVMIGAESPAHGDRLSTHYASSSHAGTRRGADKADGAAPTGAAGGGNALKSALIPAYREPTIEPVTIGAKEGTVETTKTATMTGTGAQGGAASAGASASGGGATATASAHATAVAMAKQMPATDKATPAQIERALENLSKKLEAKLPSPGSDDSTVKSAKEKESREQTAPLPDEQEPPE